LEKYIPPFKINNNIINLITEISELVGIVVVKSEMNANPHLRKDNRIKTIQATLAIENNSLSIEQVTDVINGKQVRGLPKEILEVKNAFKAYEKLSIYNPYKIKDMLRAHSVLMKDLVSDAGKFRTGNVGVFAGEKLIHMAPVSKMVPELIEKLTNWAKETDLHPLIKSCVFHYEFEFIHPFQDR